MISWLVQVLLKSLNTDKDVITQSGTTVDAFSPFQEALSKYQEVMNNLEFARELQKTFVVLGQDVRAARSAKSICVVVPHPRWLTVTRECRRH